MSNELRELYQEVILDHNKTPRNFRVLDPATHCADGDNPLCGDCVTVYLRVRNDLIEEAAFQGHGCAISTASASIMTESISGKSVSDARTLFTEFRDALTGNESGSKDFGALEALLGVRDFPMRVKCATLPWHAMDAALAEQLDPVSTESEE
jgi:nitrogen fixation NifU-like protein